MINLIFENKKYSFYIFSIYSIIFWTAYRHYQNKIIIKKYRSDLLKV